MYSNLYEIKANILDLLSFIISDKNKKDKSNLSVTPIKKILKEILYSST